MTSDELDMIDPNLTDLRQAEKAYSSGVTREPYEGEIHIAHIQVLMDREGISPGVINGKISDYFQRALNVYEARTGTRNLLDDAERVAELLEKSGGDPFTLHTLTFDDVSGPFLTELPSRIQDQGRLKRLEYLRPQEALAEKYHMDEDFLRFLNPNVDFSRPGTEIRVASIGNYLNKWVSRIRADKSLGQVTAYDAEERILAIYPASIGSEQTPSPKGRFTVRNKAGFPRYTLAADNGFEAIDDGRPVVVAPGPNNPVGSAWIGLSEKTYGIHGTPEPSAIGVAESHGCIRLTNWDALELARLVRTGIEVIID